MPGPPWGKPPPLKYCASPRQSLNRLPHSQRLTSRPTRCVLVPEMPRNLLFQARVVWQANRVVLKLDCPSQRLLSRGLQIAARLNAVATQAPWWADPALVKVFQRAVKRQEDRRSYLHLTTEKSTPGLGDAARPAGLLGQESE